MFEFDKEYKKLLNEARPVTNFRDDISLQDAYKHLLQVMKANGESNAPTFAAWDYIWRAIPEELKTPEEVQVKKKLRTDGIKAFIQEFIKRHKNHIDKDALIQNMTNDSSIIQYVNRPMGERGGRALGVKNTYGMDPVDIRQTSTALKKYEKENPTTFPKQKPGPKRVATVEPTLKKEPVKREPIVNEPGTIYPYKRDWRSAYSKAHPHNQYPQFEDED